MVDGQDTNPVRSFAAGLRAWGAELRRWAWLYLLIGLVILVVGTDPSEVTWAEAGRRLSIFELVSCCIGLVITGLYVFMTRRLVERLEPRPFVRGLVHLVTLVLGVGLGGELALRLLSAFGMEVDLVMQVRVVIWRIGASIGLVAMIASVTFDRLRRRTDAVEQRADQVERDMLRAQLAAVQARTHPHFLFNSLNTLADLVEVDPPTAVNAIERLSNLLRYALEGQRDVRVALSRELEMIQDYVELERLRFGDRLRFELQVEPGTETVPVPVFLLQPVVENAVKHGVAASRRGATVRLAVRRVDHQLELLVEDDGAGTSEAAGTQSGEADLRERLRLLYGSNASLECGPRQDGGYRVRILVEPTALTSEAA